LNQPDADGITRGDHDNGDGCGSVLGGIGCHRAGGHNDLDLCADQLPRHGGDPLGLPRGAALLHDEVPAFDVTQLVQPLAKRFPNGTVFENTDPVDSPRLLRLGGERRSDKAECCTGDERSPVDHSITWSARSRSDWGIVRPRALAVLRLAT
jgi:hypothetical protein